MIIESGAHDDDDDANDGDDDHAHDDDDKSNLTRHRDNDARGDLRWRRWHRGGNIQFLFFSLGIGKQSPRYPHSAIKFSSKIRTPLKSVE